MNAPTSIDATEEQHSAAPSRTAKVVSIFEVLVAFVVVHVGFRAIKHFTEWGRAEGAARLNFTPGMVMIAFTVCVLLVCGRKFAIYGLTLARWRESLKVGLLWGLVLVTGAGLLRAAGVRHEPGATPPTMAEGVIYGGAVLAAIIMLAWMLRRQRTILERAPTSLAVLVLCVVLSLPLFVALGYGRPFEHTLFTILWLVIGAGCGEEIFYRGYIQSRVNEAFGRPFQFMGIQFGLGLIMSSLLFGFLHALNSVDYFEGRFTFAWGFGVANVFTGLLYGCLRETTGSVLAPAVTHVTLDVLVIIPGLIRAG